jgi:membrane protein
MRKTFSIFLDASRHFDAEDGWAIASHIALSTLTSLFPFLIFVAALAGFVGSKNLADEADKLMFAAWPPVVAQPIPSEVRSVLTAPHGGLLTIGAALALYFSSGAIEAARIGLNRAYGTEETRPWWLLRLESTAYVLIGAISLLALAFLVVLGPLIWANLTSLAPALAPLQPVVTLTRLGIASLLVAVSLFIAHRWLPKGHRSMIDSPGNCADFRKLRRFRRTLWRISFGIRTQLCVDLCGPRLSDGLAYLSLFYGPRSSYMAVNSTPRSYGREK